MRLAPLLLLPLVWLSTGILDPYVSEQIIGVFSYAFCVIYLVMLDIAGVIASLILIWAGIKYVFSQEDPSERARARDIMIYAMFGLLVVVVSKSLSEFILSETFNCST